MKNGLYGRDIMYKLINITIILSYSNTLKQSDRIVEKIFRKNIEIKSSNRKIKNSL